MEERHSEERQGPNEPEALHFSSKSFRQLFEDAPLGYQSLDADGKILMVNRAWLELLGYAREEVIGRSFSDFLAPQGAELFCQRFPSFKQNGAVHGVEFDMVRKDGNTITVSFEGRISRNPDGSFRETHCILTDMSEKKRAEEALAHRDAQFRGLVNNAGSGVAIIDLDGRLTFVNQALCELGGYTGQELLEKNFSDFLHPDDVGLILNTLLKAHSEPGLVPHVEFRVIRKDGSVRHCFSAPTAQLVNGEIRGFVAIVFDITDRKRAEEALKSSEERFRKMFDEGPLGMAVTDMNYRFLDANTMFCQILGYSADELSRITFRDFTHKDHLAQDNEGMRRLAAGELPVYRTEKRYIRKDGSEVWGGLTVSLLHDATGQPVAHLVMLEDITVWKGLEDAMHGSVEMYRSLVENTSEGILLTAPDGRIFSANPAACLMLGRSEEDICRLGRNGIVDTGDPRLKPALEERARTGKFKDELTMVREDMTRFSAEVSSAIFELPDGEKRTVMIISDITERKHAENALRESEEKFRNLAEQSPNMIFINRRGRIVYANRRCEELLGYSREELYSHEFDFFRLVAPEFRNLNAEKYGAHLSGRDLSPYEYAVVSKSGKRIDAILSTRRISYGGETAMLGMITDITERRRSEEALKKSEEKYRELFENAQIGMYRSRIDGSAFIEVNQKMADIFGFSRKELLGTPSRSRWADPNDRDRVLAILKERGGTLVNYKTRMLTKNGEIKDVEASFELHEKEGYLEGTTADITEQTRAADALRESEKWYRSLFENMQEGYAYCKMVFDGRGQPEDWIYLDVNRMFGRITGQENVVGKKVTEVYPNIKEVAPELFELYGRVAQTGKPEAREVNISGLGSKAGWLNISVFSPVKGDFVAVFSDITERKKAELALRRALMRYELEEGRMYLVLEGSPRISFEAFRDLLKAGYDGIVVTRETGAASELWQQVRCTVVPLSTNAGKGALPPDAEQLERWAESLAPGKAVLFDRLDYLVTRIGFKNTLLLVHRLGEIARDNGHIIFLSVDPATLEPKEIRLLEKEGRLVEPLVRESVPEDLLETMKYIYEKNIVGVRPTFASVGRDLGLSKPTVRKRIRELLRTGSIVLHAKGSGKTLELSEKGRAVFLR